MPVLLAVSSAVVAAPTQWSAAAGGNGHYYDVIDASLTWEDSRIAAEASSFLGTAGHLVSITSAEENLFLTDTFGPENLDAHWIGLFQLPGSDEPDGGWTWTTGEPFSFSGWFPLEPNNGGGLEDRAMFQHPVQAFGKPWNDVVDGVSLGYVIEYPVMVPEPSAISMTVIGLFSLLVRRRIHPQD